MKPREDLFELIKAMTPSEKRYFRLSATATGKDKSVYMKLFDAIAAMESYDEPQLKRKFSKEKFIRQLWVAKNYLYEVILKSLVQTARESSVAAEMYSEIVAAEILYNKGLWEQCLRQTEKTERKALRHEHFMIMEQLLEWKMKVLHHEHDLEGIIRLLAAQRTWIQKRQREIELKEAAFRIYKFVSENEQKKSSPSATLQQLAASIHKRPVNEADSTLMKYYYYSALMLYHRHCGNRKGRLANARKALNVLEKNPFFLQSYPKTYLSAVNNLCNALLDLTYLKQTEEHLKQVKERVLASKGQMRTETKAAAVATILNAEMLLMVNHHRFDNIEKLERETNALVKTHGGLLDEISLADLCFNTAHALFLSGRCAGVNDYLFPIISRAKIPAFADVYTSARMLSLMAHHETGYPQLGSLVEAAAKYLQRQKMLAPFDKLFLDYLKQKNPQRKKALLKELLKLLEQPDQPASYFLSKIDIRRWLQRKADFE